MHRRGFLKQFMLAVSLAAMVPMMGRTNPVPGNNAVSLRAGEKPPNIVFILADDMSYDSVSALNPKMGPLKTPQIDRLVSQGMYFADAHSG